MEMTRWCPKRLTSARVECGSKLAAAGTAGNVVKVASMDVVEGGDALVFSPDAVLVEAPDALELFAQVVTCPRIA
ncbi:hypothetical protein PF003_g23274 [Phytophthora fragariae]|nr:hypothetical protein PF003_g23274 [Phytophthora fragariae]